jgi:hypothetical protein
MIFLPIFYHRQHKIMPKRQSLCSKKIITDFSIPDTKFQNTLPYDQFFVPGSPFLLFNASVFFLTIITYNVKASVSSRKEGTG